MNNHYYNRYLKLLEHSRNNPPNEGERHHIVPKCIGGTDEEENIILLGYREHYIAHYLLAKAYPDHQNLWYAFKMMKRVCEGKSVLYESARKYITRLLKGDKERAKKISAALTGKIFTEEHCDNIKASKIGEKNPMYNKNHKDSTLEKMRENGLRGRKMYHHIETGKNIYLKEEEEVPDDYQEGAGTSYREKQKIRKYSMKWFHDPETKEQMRLGHDELPPKGYIKGRIPLPKTECCGKMWDPGNLKKHRNKTQCQKKPINIG